MAEMRNEKIGGFGFHALRYWHGEHVRNVFEGGGVWEFLRTRAVCRSHKGEPISYTPSIANISMVYCLENNIDSIHLYPRQSNMTNTACLYTQWILEQTKGRCHIFWYTYNKNQFLEILERMWFMCKNSSDACKRVLFNSTLDSVSNRDVDNSGNTVISLYIDKDDEAQLLYTTWPIYVFVEDALFTYSWEKELKFLNELRKSGHKVYFVAFSTLNQNVNTNMRRMVERKLLSDRETVFFNDEIYYKKISEDVNIENPAVVRSDFRFVFKDTADEYIRRMVALFGDDAQDTIMSELYLQYAKTRTQFIG